MRSFDFIASALVTGLLFAACVGLTQGDVAAIEAVDAAACGALSAIPIAGGFLAAACVGEEATLRAALDKATAAQTAVAAGPAGTPPAALALAGSTHVHRRHRGRLKVVGLVPAHLAASCQAALDVTDGGGL